MSNSRQFWILLLALFSYGAIGQSFDKKISNTQLKLPNENIKGYSTFFDFTQEEVRLAWWKYAKKFALPKNQRTHYEVTIPASEKSREMVIYTQSLGEGQPATFKLGIETAGMSSDEKEKYSNQAESMILDFKRWHYLRYYEESLEKLEKDLPPASSMDWEVWMEFVKKREEILIKIKGI
jgi:hypothetical protein